MAKSKSKAKTKAKLKAKPAAKKKSAKPAPKKAAKKTTAQKTVSKSAPKLAAIPAKSLIPLEDRLLVSVEGPSETTAGGIIIPGTVSERPNRGRVLASGRGRRNKKGSVRPLDVSVGDTVLFSSYAGTKVEIGGEELLILREEDVLAIVT